MTVNCSFEKMPILKFKIRKQQQLPLPEKRRKEERLTKPRSKSKVINARSRKDLVDSGMNLAKN